MFAMPLRPLLLSKHIPAGARETMRQLFVTRFMFFGAMVCLFLFAGIALIVWIETKRPEKDNLGVYIAIFGFVTTNIGVLLANAKGERVHDVLQGQNIVMEEVHQKVNGGTERLKAAMQAEHEAAMAAMREELRRERHDLKGEKQHLLSRAELAEQEAKAFAASVAKLEAQVATLMGKVGGVAGERGERGERGDKGEPGDRPC